MTWAVRAVCAAAVVAVAYVCAVAWPVLVHGHPAYAVLLALTLLVAAVVAIRSGRERSSSTWRRVLRVLLVVAAVGWVGLMLWLKPFTAVEPALAALESDAAVSVAEYPTQLVLQPRGEAGTTGVFFQPGARVDARAYAAVLRPLAAAGHVVVIAKQPLGIAFLSIGTFSRVQSAWPGVTRWVIAGHSLGGTVAAMDADAHDSDTTAPAVGLMFYASYPASDISQSLSAAALSVSATEDGLATPEKIDASRTTLPASARFVAIEGAVHAYFGDYGPQPGDGTPTISHDDARRQIAARSLEFVTSLSTT
jgi:hypothetical protein